jgi:CheY-like chemotaxis protein
VTEFTEAPERLLHLFECAPAVGFLRKPILEEQANVAVSDAHRRSELMCEHMQDVVDINRHATAERNTPSPRIFSDLSSALSAVSACRVLCFPDSPPSSRMTVARRLILQRTKRAGWPVRGKTNVPQKRILLVDDYPDALEIWGLYLRSLGYTVETADDGLSAVEQAHHHLPDIIVLDLELPGITGFEAAVRLRQAPDTAAIPLIAATGYSHVKQLNQARESGFDSIVIKPCEPAALVGEIERLLQKTQEHRSQPQPVAVESLSHNR